MDLFSTSWNSDNAKGVIGHPVPMAKYELIPPPADPLGSYLREKITHWGYQSSEETTILGFAKPRMVTLRSRGGIVHSAPNDKSMLIPPIQ